MSLNFLKRLRARRATRKSQITNYTRLVSAPRPGHETARLPGGLALVSHSFFASFLAFAH